MVSFSMTASSPGSASMRLFNASPSSISASSLRGLSMLTSGSRMGTSPAAEIRAAYSNCWSAIAATPSLSASWITDRIFVPKIRCRVARSSNSSSVSIGFISCTPPCSAASPLSTFRNGTTCFSAHRYRAVGRPWVSRSMVCSNKIAPRMREPLKAGSVSTRVRIAWMRPNISSSEAYWLSLMPYSASAFGVLPPLWSSAAKNPRPKRTFSSCAGSIATILPAPKEREQRGRPNGGHRATAARTRSARALGVGVAQGLAERVVDLVVSGLDEEALLGRVYVAARLGRVDVDRLLAGVGIDDLLARVDIDGLLARVDMDELLAQTDLGAVVARSSGGVASNALDVIRSQAVGLDEFIARLVGRFRRRPYTDPPDRPYGPGDGRLEDAAARNAAAARTPAAAQEGLQGRYAGFASRLAAYMADVGVSTIVFTVALAVISFAASVVTGKSISWNRTDTWAGIAYLAWLFLYFAYSWAASGKTFGMALLGVQVVRSDRAPAGARRAVVRTLALPLSFLFFGLGFVGILVG